MSFIYGDEGADNSPPCVLKCFTVGWRVRIPALHAKKGGALRFKIEPDKALHPYQEGVSGSFGRHELSLPGSGRWIATRRG